MRIPGGQVLWRDLAILPRSRRMYRVRAAYLLLLLAAFLIVALGTPAGRVGRAAFQTIAVLEGLLVLVFGAIAVAPAIVEERELGTEPLLRIAGVTRAGWIAGKVVPRLLEVAYAALAGVPFLAAGALLGGVEGREIAWLAVALPSVGFFTGMAGLLLLAFLLARRPRSAGRRRRRRATDVPCLAEDNPVAWAHHITWSPLERAAFPGLPLIVLALVAIWAAMQEFLFGTGWRGAWSCCLPRVSHPAGS